MLHGIFGGNTDPRWCVVKVDWKTKCQRFTGWDENEALHYFNMWRNEGDAVTLILFKDRRIIKRYFSTKGDHPLTEGMMEATEEGDTVCITPVPNNNKKAPAG